MKIVVFRADDKLEQIEIPSGGFDIFEGANRHALILKNGFSHIFTTQGKYLGAGFRKANPTELMSDSLVAYEAQRVIQDLPVGG